MRARVLFVALALTAAPGLVFAQCSGGQHDQVTMSCPEGQTFDINTQTCLPPATG